MSELSLSGSFDDGDERYGGLDAPRWKPKSTRKYHALEWIWIWECLRYEQEHLATLRRLWGEMP